MVKCRKIYFSTDTYEQGEKIVEKYGLRFQIEFLYQDANQFTGLEQCQARNKEKFDFHLNTSLTTVSLAKGAHWADKNTESLPPFSMANLKILYHNELMLQKSISLFGINPNIDENRHKLNPMATFGTLAA